MSTKWPFWPIYRQTKKSSHDLGARSWSEKWVIAKLLDAMRCHAPHCPAGCRPTRTFVDQDGDLRLFAYSHIGRPPHLNPSSCIGHYVPPPRLGVTIIPFPRPPPNIRPRGPNVRRGAGEGGSGASDRVKRHILSYSTTIGLRCGVRPMWL